MQVITYGPSKMGYDKELDETYFTTELMVDGRNSGMFVNRSLFPDLKRFIGGMTSASQLQAYMETSVRKMVSTALFEVDSAVVAKFIADEIKKAK